MNKRNRFSVIAAVLASALLVTMLSGCGGKKAAAEASVPAAPAESVSTAAPVETPETAVETGRQDGERYEDVIILEGMEETVYYEHVRNETIGVEMDYDYQQFTRNSGADRECFVSVYDRPDAPENYLEVTYSTQDANTVAAAISEVLLKDYEISREDSFPLDRAGSCIRIDASAEKGGLTMPDLLQMVYIIPAADGCRIATAHYAIEASEGFGRRFRYMMNTFAVIDRQEESRPTGMWQTSSMGYEADGSLYPEYYVQFTDTDVVYGHMKDGAFAVDHADKIALVERTATGGYIVQAKSANGVQYTYRTCESDSNLLEYYETWREEDFPGMYRGGASLFRSN